MRVILSALQTVNTYLERIVMILGGLLVGFMVIIVFGGAVTRYVTGIGFSVVLELPPMLMPWLVFPLAGALLRSNSHIAVDFLPDRLGGSGKRILRAVVAAIAAAASVVFTIAGVDAVSLFKMVGQMTEMEWEFPIWWIYLSFPVGFVILFFFAMENLLRALVGDDDIDSDGGANDDNMRDARAMSE